jgi:hypothetical protein
MKNYLPFFLFLFSLTFVSAQCPFDSTITSSPDLGGGNQVVCSDQVIVFTAPSGYDSYQWKYKFSATGSPTNFPGETSNTLSIIAGDLGFAYVFVTITDDDCTEDSNDIMFDTWVFLSPAISHNSNTSLCYGETSIISSAFQGPESFRWFKDGVIVYEGPQDFYEVSEAGSYLLSVSYEQCPQFWLSSGVPVNFTVAGEEVEIEEIDGTLYTTQNGFNYNWYLEGENISGANTYFYTPVSTGNYTVQVAFTNSPTCLILSESFFFDQLSLNDHHLFQDVYFVNTLAINNEFVLNNTSSKPLNINMFDVTGKLVYSAKSSDQTLVISPANLKNGIYFCRIESEGKIKSVSLIK